MSEQVKFRFGVMVAVCLMVGAGCSSGGAGAKAKSTDYDYGALDFYLSDAKKPVHKVNDAPSSMGKTVGTKSLDRSSTKGKAKRVVPIGKFPKGRVFGEWVGSIDMAAAMDSAPATGDPEMAAMAREMGKAMAEMMSGMFSMSLDLHKNYTFDGLMVGMKLEGKWKQTGDRLFLKPTKVMGKTEKELKKMAKKMTEGFGSDGKMKMTMTTNGFEPLELRIAEGGKALIAMNPDDSTDQELVFRRKQ